MSGWWTWEWHVAVLATSEYSARQENKYKSTAINAKNGDWTISTWPTDFVLNDSEKCSAIRQHISFTSHTGWIMYWKQPIYIQFSNIIHRNLQYVVTQSASIFISLHCRLAWSMSLWYISSVFQNTEVNLPPKGMARYHVFTNQSNFILKFFLLQYHHMNHTRQHCGSYPPCKHLGWVIGKKVQLPLCLAN